MPKNQSVKSNPTFGELFKSWREQAGFPRDQEGFAELVGITDRTKISKIENGKIPTREEALNYAKKLREKKPDVSFNSDEEVIAALEESKLRNPGPAETILGNYEVFQWGYASDQKIMKIHTTVKTGSNSRKMIFEERIMYRGTPQTLNGEVVDKHNNLFFYGNKASFKECEVIILRKPRAVGSWVKGVVAGIESETTSPSASRVVACYLGQKKFSGKPQYASIEEIELPPDEKEFLSMPANNKFPILSTLESTVQRAPEKVKTKKK